MEDLTKFLPILIEQKEQFTKWKDKNHHPHVYNTILSEEVGEVAEAILKTDTINNTKNWKDVIKELIQVQAVAQSMIESIKRNQL